MDRHLQHWRPQLRRAMMKARPEYFGWPRDRQERWGVAIAAEDRACLEQALLAELFGRVCATQADAEAAFDQLSRDEQNLWNEAVLPLYGLGEDCFFLNEAFADDESLLDFETLRDFDEDNYRFQENARKEEDPDYPGRPYRGSLYLTWARLFVDGRFAYATLSTAAGYLYSRLESSTREFLEQRIPHRYVPGRNHGKVRDKCVEWDMRLDANGEEGILKELRRRVWRYELNRWDSLATAYDESEVSGAYLLDETKHGEFNLHFVFSNKSALSAVRFRSFLRDCRRIERPASEIKSSFESERAALAAFIERQHAEIRRTYDPKVTRLVQRRKIMVAKDAFD